MVKALFPIGSDPIYMVYLSWPSTYIGFAVKGIMGSHRTRCLQPDPLTLGIKITCNQSQPPSELYNTLQFVVDNAKVPWVPRTALVHLQDDPTRITEGRIRIVEAWDPSVLFVTPAGPS